MNQKAKANEFVNEEYDIAITGRHVLVTEGMKSYAFEKLSKIERLADKIMEIQVTMDIQKLDHRVDIVVKVNHIKIKSSASSEDMYISIDRAVEKLQTQLSRYKTKLQEHLGKSPLSAVDMHVNVLQPAREGDLFDVNADIEDENQRLLVQHYAPHQIVSQEKLQLKLLTVEEAVMKMELSGNAFLIFRDERDRQLKVIYRRSDDNYGIIELENLQAVAS